jgi:hypothetical protein
MLNVLVAMKGVQQRLVAAIMGQHPQLNLRVIGCH